MVENHVILFFFSSAIIIRHSGKLCHTPLQECRQGAHLPFLGHEPVDGYTSKS